MLTSAEDGWADPEIEHAKPDLEAHPIVEPGPCVDCAMARRCGSQLLACSVFVQFVEHGGADRWVEVLRSPNRKIFDRLFPDPIEMALTRSSASLRA